jgi:hypothetical protein
MDNVSSVKPLASPATPTVPVLPASPLSHLLLGPTERATPAKTPFVSTVTPPPQTVSPACPDTLLTKESAPLPVIPKSVLSVVLKTPQPVDSVFQVTMSMLPLSPASNAPTPQPAPPASISIQVSVSTAPLASTSISRTSVSPAPHTVLPAPPPPTVLNFHSPTDRSYLSTPMASPF